MLVCKLLRSRWYGIIYIWNMAWKSILNWIKISELCLIMKKGVFLSELSHIPTHANTLSKIKTNYITSSRKKSIQIRYFLSFSTTICHPWILARSPQLESRCSEGLQRLSASRGHCCSDLNPPAALGTLRLITNFMAADWKHLLASLKPNNLADYFFA